MDEDVHEPHHGPVHVVLPEDVPLTEDGLPSVGSAEHATGECKRCAFFPKGRCKNGVDCTHCHFPHEERRRKRNRRRGVQDGTDNVPYDESATTTGDAAEPEGFVVAQECVSNIHSGIVGSFPQSRTPVILPANVKCDGTLAFGAVTPEIQLPVPQIPVAAEVPVTVDEHDTSECESDCESDSDSGDADVEDEAEDNTFANPLPTEGGIAFASLFRRQGEGQACPVLESDESENDTPSSMKGEETAEDEDELNGLTASERSIHPEDYDIQSQACNALPSPAKGDLGPSQEQGQSTPCHMEDQIEVMQVHSKQTKQQRTSNLQEMNELARHAEEEARRLEMEAEAAEEEALRLQQLLMALQHKPVDCIEKEDAEKCGQSLPEDDTTAGSAGHVVTPSCSSSSEEGETTASDGNAIVAATSRSPLASDSVPEERRLKVKRHERRSQPTKAVKDNAGDSGSGERVLRSPLWPSCTPAEPVSGEVKAPAHNAKGLQVSATSWAAAAQERRRQREQEAGDKSDEVARHARGILNKLTEKRFETLYTQLLECGIRTSAQLEVVVAEIFEKATTQHFFLKMYVELCVRLDVHFRENPVTGSDFRKVLVGECQRTFERNLQAPTYDTGLSYEERYEAEVKFKNRMLGNLRFIGELLVQKLLAGKILLAVSEELLAIGSGEAIEAAATLLQVAAPAFDRNSWVFVPRLRAIFSMLRSMSSDTLLPMRVRCVLKDLLEFRDSGWKGTDFETSAGTDVCRRSLAKTNKKSM